MIETKGKYFIKYRFTPIPTRSIFCNVCPCLEHMTLLSLTARKNILRKYYYITGVYIFSIYGGEINNFQRSWDKMKTWHLKMQGFLSCFSCILLENLFNLPYFENKDSRKRT